jgi:hypothetical protein
MRTTVNIDDGLLRTAKARAAAERVPLGTLLEEGLRLYLSRTDERREVGPPLPVHDGGGFRPGVDLSTNAGLYEAMYAEEDARYAEEFGAERT